MRSIVIPLGWTYIALWSLDQNTPELACKDGWFNPEMETGSSTGQSLGQTLFNLYKLSRFALDAGVPGLAWNQPPYVWLTANELLQFSSDESQQEFYRVAHIQTAVFIPCSSGVVELGTTNLVQADEQNKLRISSLLRSLMVSPNISVTIAMPMPGTSISTSSCSSLPSRSIDSPESSSLVSYLQYPTITTTDQMNIPPDTHQYSMSTSELAGGFYPHPSSGHLISDHDQETTLVYQLGSNTQQISVPGLLLFPQTSQASGFPAASSATNMMPSAFGMWRPPSNMVTPRIVEGQYKLKRCLSILRNIHAERLAQVSMSGSQRPPGGTVSSSQVHHMISERRRRERLKESFEALRSFFPRGGRKDKASILGYTREYLTSLKSRVEQLEERNKQLESELKKFMSRAQSQEGAGTSIAQQQYGSTSTEGNDSAVRVTLSKIEGSTSTSTSASDEMRLVVVVENPTNTIDLLIALLKSLREMGVPLISMATSTTNDENDPSRLQFRMTATIKLQDQDVGRVKEGLVSAVKNDGGQPPPPPS
nr:bHLH15 [Pinus massoniana]